MGETFSCKIDVGLKDKLLADLQDQGFEISNPPYTVFAAKKGKINCTLYTSGSLVVQGKDKKDFIEFYLEPEILKNFSFTNPEIFLKDHIGVDEAGKGDFFGPLVIAGAFGNEKEIRELIKLGIKDSKLLTDVSVIKKAALIKNICPFDIIILKPSTYNELYEKFKNLNSLLAWGHATVIENLIKKTNCKYAISDQFASSKSLLENMLKKKHVEIELEQKHRAEEDVVVAAASILARAAFLDSLEKLSQEVGEKLPKGASNPNIVKIAEKLVAIHGRDILRTISKQHFKTTDQVG